MLVLKGKKNYSEDLEYTITDHFTFEELFLESEKLTNIDLTNLSRCINLKEITISSNQLSYLNLSALSRCVELKILDLNNNL